MRFLILKNVKVTYSAKGCEIMEKVYGFCDNKCKMEVVNANHILHCSGDVNATITAGSEYGLFWDVPENNVNNLMLLGASIKTGGKIPNGGNDTDFQTIIPLNDGTLLAGFKDTPIDVKWGFNPNNNQVMLYMYGNFTDTSVEVSISGRVDAMFWEY